MTQITDNDMIVRRVSVNRTRTPQATLDATGRKQYTDKDVVETMPMGEGEEADVYFFKPKPSEYTRPGYMSDDDLEKCLEIRGIVSDHYAQAAVNEEDPAFADDYPNGTHWKHDGRWHFASFSHWLDERSVGVLRYDFGWDDDWWFGGVRKYQVPMVTCLPDGRQGIIVLHEPLVP